MNTYYLYKHVHPETKDIVYVGVGKLDRAWQFGKTSRNGPHNSWYLEMYEKGYTLTDIVFIEKKGLSKEEAFKEELTLIKDTKPIFNQLSNPDHWFGSRNCTKEQALFAKILHEMGYGYQRIAYLLGASKPIGAHMTIKRMITYV